jgi:hypothetical protein
MIDIMLMHIGLTKVIKWEIKFSFVFNKSTIQFGKGTKLSPRFIGPFKIQERIGPISYRLVLPSHLHKTHDVFHVSVLRHYVVDESPS